MITACSTTRSGAGVIKDYLYLFLSKWGETDFQFISAKVVHQTYLHNIDTYDEEYEMYLNGRYRVLMDTNRC